MSCENINNVNNGCEVSGDWLVGREGGGEWGGGVGAGLATIAWGN